MQADGTSRRGGVSRKLRGCKAEAWSPESRQLLWAEFVPLVLPDPLAMVDCEGCRKRRVFHAPGTAQPSALQLGPALQFLDCKSWPCGLAPLRGYWAPAQPPTSSIFLSASCSEREMLAPRTTRGRIGFWGQLAPPMLLEVSQAPRPQPDVLIPFPLCG